MCNQKIISATELEIANLKHKSYLVAFFFFFFYAHLQLFFFSSKIYDKRFGVDGGPKHSVALEASGQSQVEIGDTRGHRHSFKLFSSPPVSTARAWLRRVLPGAEALKQCYDAIPSCWASHFRKDISSSSFLGRASFFHIFWRYCGSIEDTVRREPFCTALW